MPGLWYSSQPTFPILSPPGHCSRSCSQPFLQGIFLSASGAVPEIKRAEFIPKKPLSSRTGDQSRRSGVGCDTRRSPRGANCRFIVSLKRHPGVQLPSARGTRILFHGGMEKKPQENLWEGISQSLPRPDGCVRTMFQGGFFVPKGTSAKVASHKLEEASRFCVWLFFFSYCRKKGHLQDKFIGNTCLSYL